MYKRQVGYPTIDGCRLLAPSVGTQIALDLSLIHIYHAADHGHPPPRYRHRRVRRHHGSAYGCLLYTSTRSAVVTASRGTIYDSSLNTLAISATAEDINISPMRIAEFVDTQKENQAKAAQKATGKGETYTAPVLRDQTYIAKGLSRIDVYKRQGRLCGGGCYLFPPAMGHCAGAAQHDPPSHDRCVGAL